MPYNDPRDDISDLLLQQQNRGGALGAGLTGLSGAMPATMPAQMPAGMPATPAGGVPGAGIGPAGPSSLPLPPSRPMQGAMPAMGSLGAGMGGGQMTGMAQPVMPPPMPPPMPQAQPRPGMLGDLGGTGQMSDFQTPARMGMGRRRGY